MGTGTYHPTFCPYLLTFRHHVRESKTVLDSGIQVLDFRYLYLYSGFKSPGLWIPPDKIPGIRIPLHGANYLFLPVALKAAVANRKGFPSLISCLKFHPSPTRDE